MWARMCSGCCQVERSRELNFFHGRFGMIVSYLVTYYNKAQFMPGLLQALAQQTVDVERELVIADDGSDQQDFEQLQALVDQFSLFPVRVLRSEMNTGPAVCFNRGLEAVKGEIVVAVDADDVLLPDATAYYLELFKRHEADFVYGRRRPARSSILADDQDFIVIDDPVSYVLQEQTVHMCFAARTDLLRKAGGADPRLFVQDQSLPLRMAAVATRMIRSNRTTVTFSEDAKGVSRNVGQLHHDRFWMVMNFLADHPDLSKANIARIKDIARSALWKMDRDKGTVPIFSSNFWRYIFGRLTGLGPDEQKMKRMAGRLFAGANIRHVQ